MNFEFLIIDILMDQFCLFLKRLGASVLIKASAATAAAPGIDPRLSLVVLDQFL